MKPEVFSECRTGRVVPTAGQAITNGFVPDPLPPSWTWPECLWPVLLEAHRALVPTAKSPIRSSMLTSNAHLFLGVATVRLKQSGSGPAHASSGAVR